MTGSVKNTCWFYSKKKGHSVHQTSGKFRFNQIEMRVKGHHIGRYIGGDAELHLRLPFWTGEVVKILQLVAVLGPDSMCYSDLLVICKVTLSIGGLTKAKQLAISSQERHMLACNLIIFQIVNSSFRSLSVCMQLNLYICRFQLAYMHTPWLAVWMAINYSYITHLHKKEVC